MTRVFWNVLGRRVRLAAVVTLALLFGQYGCDGRFAWVTLLDTSVIVAGDYPGMGGPAICIWASQSKVIGFGCGVDRTGVWQVSLYCRKLRAVYFSDVGWLHLH